MAGLRMAGGEDERREEIPWASSGFEHNFGNICFEAYFGSDIVNSVEGK